MDISSLSTTATPLCSSFTFQYSPISPRKSSFFLNQTSLRLATKTRLSSARTRPDNPARNKRFCCNSLFGLGVPELAVIAGVAVLLFGPKQIPELGRSIGKTVRGFQQAAKEFEAELKKPEDSESAEEAIESKPVSDTSEEKENVSASSSKES